MKIAIIGAGVSGILSLKYAVEAGIECDCFEETETFGGIWVYTPEIGTNKNGFPINRPMYRDLITNIPKELMTLEDFPYPPNMNYSFPTCYEVLDYLRGYVNKFNLEKYIQNYTSVTKVNLEHPDLWNVTTLNLLTGATNSKVYDYVFVCSGHFRQVKIPKIPGQNVFQGSQLHSREYRMPEIYKDKNVLVVGAGYSGLDIAKQIVNSAGTVWLSQWNSNENCVSNVLNKPPVSELQANSVIFNDETREDVDVIIYCTGYEYKFPFLNDSCEITIENNWVRPLYKHIVNIQHPTMVFIGIPYYVTPFIVSEIQVQFAISLVKKHFTLPSRKDMLKELEDYICSLKTKDENLKHVHKFGFYQRKYLLDLVKTAFLKPLRPVVSDFFDYLLSGHLLEINKKISFKILNDYTFVKDV